jgi:transcriptional regulator with XRE-family HTH domain
MIQGSLAEHLRVLRARRGLTLAEAAKKTGIGRDTLSDLERGRRHPVVPTLSKIARGYGVPVEELLEEPLRPSPVEELLEGPKALAPPPLEDPADGAGVTEDPATAAALIDGAIGLAAELSAGWIQDVKRYTQDARAVPPYRTFEMSTAVAALYQQYFGAIEVLQRDAIKHGLNPDVATWDAPSKQRLIDGGSAVHALAALYDLLARSAAEENRVNLQDLQARVEEFDAGLPAFVTRDPAWSEALEKSRATAGLT